MTDVQQYGSVRWSRDGDGVVTVTLDDPGRTANMLNRRHYDGLGACLDEFPELFERVLKVDRFRGGPTNDEHDLSLGGRAP